MQKSNWSLYAMALVIAFFVAVLAWPLSQGRSPIDLGLDLSGGVLVTYRPDFSERLASHADLTEEELLALARDTLASRLERRLNTVPDVVVRGDRTIAVSIPSSDGVRETLDRYGETYHLTLRLVLGDSATAVGGEERFPYRGRHLQLAPPEFSGDMLDPRSIKVVSERGDLFDAAAAPRVAFRFAPPHDQAFGSFTAAHVGEELAILLDDRIEWAGVIESAIPDGGVLAGGYTLDEATDVAALLRSGTLPVALEVESLTAVGPSLGQAIQHLGRSALTLAVVLLVVLLVAAYLHRGWLLIAGLASLCCLLLAIAGLASVFDLTLDMVGIAGIILSVGMGMDAFIIVFESLESKLAGYSRGRLAAHSDSVSRRMYSFRGEGRTLFHANATTLVVILLLLSTERLSSFALFIFVGIFASVLTIFMTREILQRTHGLLPDLPFDPLGGLRRSGRGFFRLRRVYWIAVAAALLSTALLLTRGASGGPALELGADFRAGTQLAVVAESDVALRSALGELGARLSGVGIRDQRLGPADQGRHLVTLGTVFAERIGEGSVDSGPSLEAVAALLAERGVELESVESITGRVSGRRLARSLSVLGLSFVLLGLYFALLQDPIDRLLSARRRRRGPVAAKILIFAGVLTAVVLDVALMAAAAALFSIPINLPVIAGMLTIIGYSVNDSVVLWSHVEDRHAELRAGGQSPRPLDAVTAGVDRVLSRAFLTSLSTMIPAVTILAVGLTPLADFARVMIVGAVAGTLSSIFVVGSFATRALALGDRVARPQPREAAVI